MKLGRVVLDGSKVKANASKHKAMSYGRMQEEEKRLQEEGFAGRIEVPAPQTLHGKHSPKEGTVALERDAQIFS